MGMFWELGGARRERLGNARGVVSREDLSDVCEHVYMVMQVVPLFFSNMF